MPVAYSIDGFHKPVISIGTGTLTNDELRNHEAQLRCGPGFSPKFDRRIDLQAVTSCQVYSNALREVACKESFNTDARVVLITREGVVAKNTIDPKSRQKPPPWAC